ncbi:MAG TPA: DUF1345 domain-containing protein [Flavisolibacter sp.]|nr:DUF1345 domain-containing protein [Flavisolibacter sp.]
MKNIFTGTNSLRRHLRLYISLGLTAVVYWFIRGHYSAAFTFMLCWISFSVTLLFFLWTIIVTNHPRDMAIVASEEDSSRMVIFLFSLVAAVASLFAIILLLQSAPDSSKSGLSSHILLAAAAVGASWTLIHTLFAIRYAHMYYSFSTHEEKKQKRHSGGLIVPGDNQPDFLDFAYFSFVLGMTFQVSDVQITDRSIRRLAIIHGLLSFIYNTAIVALSINIISGVLGK